MPGSDVHSSSILRLSGWAPGVNSCFSHICRKRPILFVGPVRPVRICMYLYVLCRCCRSCTSHLNAFKEWNISRPPKNPLFHPTNRTGSFSPSHNVLENDPRRHVEDVATPTPPGERPSTRHAPGTPGHLWPHRPATMGTMGEAVCWARSWLKNPTGMCSKKRQVSGNVARIIFQWHRQGTKWKCRPTKSFSCETHEAQELQSSNHLELRTFFATRFRHLDCLCLAGTRWPSCTLNSWIFAGFAL